MVEEDSILHETKTLCSSIWDHVLVAEGLSFGLDIFSGFLKNLQFSLGILREVSFYIFSLALISNLLRYLLVFHNLFYMNFTHHLILMNNDSLLYIIATAAALTGN